MSAVAALSNGVTRQASTPTQQPRCAVDGTGSGRVAAAAYVNGGDPLKVLSRLEDRVGLAGARRIGGGSHGDILLVSDRQVGKPHGQRPLAVKVVSLERLSRLPSGEARLRKEVGALMELGGHAHLVRFVDVFVGLSEVPGAQGRPPYVCIAMDYIADSEPLAGRIKYGGPQPQLAMHVLPQLASVLGFMHGKGFVHRDVWSENVLIDRQGRVVLVDLGMAEHSMPGHRLSAPPAVNVCYASPEAMDGWGPQPGDDAWSLGLIVAELITGRFVADIVGRSDVPIHQMPTALRTLLMDVLANAPPILREIATGLLAARADRRLPMRELQALFMTGSGVIPGRAPPPVRTAGTPLVRSFVARPPPSVQQMSAPASPVGSEVQLLMGGPVGHPTLLQAPSAMTKSAPNVNLAVVSPDQKFRPLPQMGSMGSATVMDWPATRTPVASAVPSHVAAPPPLVLSTSARSMPTPQVCTTLLSPQQAAGSSISACTSFGAQTPRAGTGFVGQRELRHQSPMQLHSHVPLHAPVTKIQSVLPGSSSRAGSCGPCTRTHGAQPIAAAWNALTTPSSPPAPRTRRSLGRRVFQAPVYVVG